MLLLVSPADYRHGPVPLVALRGGNCAELLLVLVVSRPSSSLLDAAGLATRVVEAFGRSGSRRGLHCRGRFHGRAGLAVVVDAGGPNDFRAI